MKKVTKILSLLLAVLMMMSFFAACGSTSSSTETTTAPVASTEAAASTEATASTAKEPVKLTMFLDSGKANNENIKNLLADYNAKGGNQIEMNVLAGDGVEAMKKMDILLASADTTDIVLLDNPLIQNRYSKAGYLAPLNDLAKNANVDLDKIYGKHLVKDGEGKSTYLRTSSGSWAVFYNKQIFDDAKVPYPSGKWTWSQYIETAKKLTDTKKGIYGSLMLDYDCYLYFTARQKDVPTYKADGTSNFDDPAYKESLKFFADLGNVHKVQPSWLEFKTKKVAWDAFMTGKYGMHVIGTWYNGLLTDKKGYPITWKWGMTEIPVPDSGDGDRTLVAGGALGVSNFSNNKDAAFDFVNYYCQNMFKKTKEIPALAEISDGDKTALLQGIADASEGSVTVDELKKVMFDSTLGVADEKIAGAGATVINSTVLQEGELYMVGQKSLDDTVAAIKKKADEAIKLDNK